MDIRTLRGAELEFVSCTDINRSEGRDADLHVRQQSVKKVHEPKLPESCLPLRLVC